jgi:hypothetical protein
LNGRDTTSQLFQFAQAPLRFGQRIEPPLRCNLDCAIQGPDLSERFF